MCGIAGFISLSGAPADSARALTMIRTLDLVRQFRAFSESSADLVLTHHEAYDGSGYPEGLHGNQIPRGARILSVADAYDSMTHPHTQRPAMSPAMAVAEIQRCSGAQFDPEAVGALGGTFTGMTTI